MRIRSRLEGVVVSTRVKSRKSLCSHLGPQRRGSIDKDFSESPGGVTMPHESQSHCLELSASTQRDEGPSSARKSTRLF